MLIQTAAHVKMVQILLDIYEADVNLLAGEAGFNPPVHVLEVALQHPKDTCRSLLKMFLQHGASLFDKSTRTISISVLHLAIVRYRDTLDIFAEYDSENFMHAITKVTWKESVQCDTPLTW